MNKLLKITRYILLILLIIINLLYLVNIKSIVGISHFIYYFLLIIIFILNIKDIYKKDNINSNKGYNIICILTYLIIIFIFFRTIYDKEILTYFKIFFEEEYYLELYRIGFLKQNMMYINIMLLLIIVYRKINKSLIIDK